jgi:hypothetical protein
MLNIYKLTIEGLDKCYIGSTKQKICNRCARHRCDYKNKERLNKNCSSFELFALEDENKKVKYELIETTNLITREGEIIRDYGDRCVNYNVNIGLGLKKQKELAFKKWKEEKRDDYLKAKKKHSDKKRHLRQCPKCKKEIVCYYGENDGNMRRHIIRCNN